MRDRRTEPRGKRDIPRHEPGYIPLWHKLLRESAEYWVTYGSSQASPRTFYWFVAGERADRPTSVALTDMGKRGLILLVGEKRKYEARVTLPFGDTVLMSWDRVHPDVRPPKRSRWKL